MNHLLIIAGFYFICNFCFATLNAESLLECDFERDTCGFVNDVDHETRWERKQMDLGGRRGTVMVLEAGIENKQRARLLSPILDGHWSHAEGCLSLELFTGGDGVTAFRVKQQDDSGVLPLLGVHTEVKQWRKYELDVSVSDFIRFIFEANVNPDLGGTLVAIDNVSFTLEECKE